MPFGDYGTYKTRPLIQRQDTDNKIFMWARALSGATYKSYYILAPTAGTTVMGTSGTGCGYVATAAFATGKASATAAAGVGSYFVGFSNETLASGNDGWFQVGGPLVSATLGTQSATTGNMYCWASATVSNFTASPDLAWVNCFGIAMTSNTGGLPAGATAATFTSHDIYLLNKPVCGIG